MSAANWSSNAELDLEEIAFYIAMQDGRPTTADRIVREVRELCDLIASSPGMGQSRPELGLGCRVFSFKRWAIVFRPTDDGINVLRFVDGARDYDQLF